MERLAVWVVLAALYGGVLYLLVEAIGQEGFFIWLVLVVIVQIWLARRARGY
jgi:hypothetical protein